MRCFVIGPKGGGKTTVLDILRENRSWEQEHLTIIDRYLCGEHVFREASGDPRYATIIRAYLRERDDMVLCCVPGNRDLTAEERDQIDGHLYTLSGLDPKPLTVFVETFADPRAVRGTAPNHPLLQTFPFDQALFDPTFRSKFTNKTANMLFQAHRV